MSERQYEIYSFIVKYIKENLYPPTFAEICQGTSIKSKSTVSDHLLGLENLGYVEVKLGTPRAIKLIGYAIVESF